MKKLKAEYPNLIIRNITIPGSLLEEFDTYALLRCLKIRKLTIDKMYLDNYSQKNSIYFHLIPSTIKHLAIYSNNTYFNSHTDNHHAKINVETLFLSLNTIYEVEWYLKRVNPT